MTRTKQSLRAWLDLLKVSNTLKKTIDTEFRQSHGLSLSRFDVLAALARAPREGMRAGALSELLMVTEGNTTQVTAPLIRDGLVKKNTSPDDGRVVNFKLTKKGERIFAEMADENRRLIHDVFAGLSAHELGALRALLAKLDIPGRSAKEGKDAA